MTRVVLDFCPQMMLYKQLPKHNMARILETVHCRTQFLSLIRFLVGGVGLCKSCCNCSNHCNYCTVTTKWITVLMEPSGFATEPYNTIFSDCDLKKQFWSFGLHRASSLTITIKKKKLNDCSHTFSLCVFILPWFRYIASEKNL